MSSSGTVSGVSSSPTTSLGEERRQQSLQSGSAQTIDEKVDVVEGIIREIHPEKMLVRATTKDGKTIANDEWIALNYPSVEFTQNFGDINLGDVISVTVVGLNKQATAVIVGRGGEGAGTSNRLENKVKLGVGPFLFPPGIGIG